MEFNGFFARKKAIKLRPYPAHYLLLKIIVEKLMQICYSTPCKR